MKDIVAKRYIFDVQSERRAFKIESFCEWEVEIRPAIQFRRFSD